MSYKPPSIFVNHIGEHIPFDENGIAIWREVDEDGKTIEYVYDDSYHHSDEYKFKMYLYEKKKQHEQNHYMKDLYGNRRRIKEYQQTYSKLSHELHNLPLIPYNSVLLTVIFLLNGCPQSSIDKIKEYPILTNPDANFAKSPLAEFKKPLQPVLDSFGIIPFRVKDILPKETDTILLSDKDFKLIQVTHDVQYLRAVDLRDFLHLAKIIG